MRFGQALTQEAEAYIQEGLKGERFLAVHLRRRDFLAVRRDAIPSIHDTVAQVRHP